RSSGSETGSPKLQPQLNMNEDDSDFSLYQAVSNTSMTDAPQALHSRHRTSSVGQKFKSLFTPHSMKQPSKDKLTTTGGTGSNTKSPNSQPGSPALSATSSINSPSLQSQPNEKQTISSAELTDSFNKLRVMPCVVENDLDEVLENAEDDNINSSSVNHMTTSASSTTTSQLTRGRSGKLMSKFLGGSHHNASEESLSPPESRSTSRSSVRRSNSISAANLDPYLHNGSYNNSLKHSQTLNYSSTQLNAQKDHLLKLKNGRLKISPDGSTHEHDYMKYRTQPVRNSKGWFSWAKKKEDDADSYATIEESISLLPDSYSEQLIELKSDPKNYRWNYDDSDEGSDSGNDSEDEGDDDEEEVDEDDFDDDADDELIEPIIGKDQLNLINIMMDKIEHPEKFKEKLSKSSKKLNLTAKYGHIEGVVGRGSYGTVTIAIKTDPNDKKRKSLFAIKQLKQRTNETLHRFGNRVTSEFMISSSLTHQAIINVYDLMVDPVTLTYSQVMEFIPCGDLFSLISVTSGLEVIECDCFFKQILNAITYLHSVGISHNDLKVENLLLTRKGQLKIIDFGTSAVFKTAWEDKVQYSKGACGSERYVSPEQFSSDKDYDPRLADIWSLGIIYLVMMYGNYVWETAQIKDDNYEHFLATRAIYDYTQKSSTMAKQFKLVKKGAFNHIESISKGAFPNSRRYVLYNILNPDPKYRMRSYQIWQSEWVKSINVCEAGRGMLSHEDYVDMAYNTFQAAQ
ncbi:hypothetical protein CANARDRAFT_181994, partial [[Candida] arabinofermentans NRRL YB-2248]